MELVGTIKKISPLQQITPTFSKREVVILTDEMYPQTIMVEFAQSRAARRCALFHVRRRMAYRSVRSRHGSGTAIRRSCQSVRIAGYAGTTSGSCSAVSPGRRR